MKFGFALFRIAEHCPLPWVSLVRTAELWCNSVSGFLRTAELCDLPCTPVSKLQNCAEFRPLYPSSWAEGSKSCFWSLALKPYILFNKLLSLGSWSSLGLLGGPWASLGCLGYLGLPAAFLGLSWRSPGARLVHSWAVVVKVVLVVVVVVVVAAVVVVVVVAVGRTRGCWLGWWFGVRWLLVGFGWLGPLVD